MKRIIITISVLVLILGSAAVGVQFLPKESISPEVVSNILNAKEVTVTESSTVSSTEAPISAENVVGNTVENTVDISNSPDVSPEKENTSSETAPKRRRFQTVDELPTVDNAENTETLSIPTFPSSGEMLADPYAIPNKTKAEATTNNINGVEDTLSPVFQIPSPVTLGTGQNSSTTTVKVLSTEREVENGVIIPIYEVDVPAEEAGVLRELYVEDFEQVKKDQKLVQIDDRQAVMAVSVAEAKKESAEIQMNNNVNVRYAIAAYNVADAEIKQADEANEKVKHTVTITEYNRLVLSRTQAQLQIEQAQQELKVAKQTYNVQMEELASAKLDQTKFKIHSPHDGVVMELYRHQGEWLKPGDPILRLVQMNPIRYSFRIESKTPPESIFNQPVTIFVPTLNKQFQGKVTYIKPSHDIGDMYQVWVDIENTWQAFTGQDEAAKQKGYWILQPGMRAEVKKIGK